MTKELSCCSSQEEWHRKRALGIGGSDAAAILGKNPYRNNVELWEIKTGIRQQEDISDKPYVKFGTLAEDPMREIFKLDYPMFEVYHENWGNKQNPDFPFIRGSFDGELVERTTGKRGILEIKTTNILQSMQKENWNDKVPENYFIQILHYFLVDPKMEYAILKARLRYEYNGEIRATIRHYLFLRSDYKQDLELLLEEEIKFWDCVINDRRPNLILPPI